MNKRYRARGLALAATIAVTGGGSVARAAEPVMDLPLDAKGATDVKNDVPILVYTYQAAGVQAQTFGVQAYGLGSGATGGVGYAGAKHGIVGGGVTLWGSPIDRLTIVVDAPRDVTGNFAPSAAAIVRLFGRADDGFSMGLLGKFKVEGFGVGVHDEIESEIEGGVLVSYARAKWHADLNAVTGFGTGDDGEIDSEARLRVGRDIGIARVGVDGQARYRMAGTESLIGGRKGDFSGGPQVMIGDHHFYGALTAGPTTTNIFNGIGWTAVATVGGVSF